MIVGLGNPGQKYEKTRHNVGFWTIDRIAFKLDIKVDKKLGQSLVQTGVWQGKQILLVKPQTYMNLSGQACIQLLNFYQDRIKDLIVIHDDLDLPVGQLRFKKDGGTGGHNGLKSIAQHLNSHEFNRLKIGIGRPRFAEVSDYVLTAFLPEEKKAIEDAVDEAVEGIEAWIKEGIDQTMNIFNRKKA
ncbi:MAG: aminoacyl-tRNA hydrolase [Bacillota bacterium]